MNMGDQLPRTMRFGVFEVDFQAREIRKRGLRLKLQEKPFQILESLLRRPGEVVTRKELREKLWPDIHVGFDRSLNTAINALRQVLGDSPSNPRFIETRPRLGYRFIASLESPRTGPHTLLANDAIDSIAVLPFQNSSGEEEMDYLSDGITESLIQNLSQLAPVRVLARSTVFRYKGHPIDPQRVGRELEVRALLTGWVAQRRSTLVIGAELVDAGNGGRIWGEQYHRKVSDVATVEGGIAGEIAEKLRWRLSGKDKDLLARRYTESAEAYRDYLRGRYCYNKMTEEGLRKSIDYYEGAIRRDSGYALAYAGLADSYGMFAFFGLLPPPQVMPQAKEYAITALRLDDSLAEAHTSLASIRKAYDWDWPGAEVEYQSALELNPNHAASHRLYGDYLAALGRSEAALREMQIAQNLDPLSLVISMEIAWILYMAHDYERSVEQALRTLEMEPRFSAARHILGLAYARLGRHAEALKALTKAREGSGKHPAILAALGEAYGWAGSKRAAMRSLSELRRLSQERYVPPCWLAAIHAALDERDAALEWLEKAYQNRDVYLVWLRASPSFENLRRDPRLGDLLQRIGLGRPASAIATAPAIQA